LISCVCDFARVDADVGSEGGKLFSLEEAGWERFFAGAWAVGEGRGWRSPEPPLAAMAALRGSERFGGESGESDDDEMFGAGPIGAGIAPGPCGRAFAVPSFADRGTCRSDLHSLQRHTPPRNPSSSSSVALQLVHCTLTGIFVFPIQGRTQNRPHKRRSGLYAEK
jgi:hypothetical protein